MRGSVGASGDLSPLYICLVLIGEGEAIYKGEHLSGEKAMQKAGITPVNLLPRKDLR